MAATQYAYTVRDKSGKSVEGTMSGPNEQAVAEKLKQLGYTPISVTRKSTSLVQTEINISFLQRIKPQDLTVFSRQFATMVSAGLPMVRSLIILSQQSENPLMAKIVGEMSADVQRGIPLSEAMAKQKDFPKLYTAMIKAGETAGQLDEVMNRVADTLEKEIALSRKVKSAMAYPTVVLVLALVMSLGMLIFVVPVFQGMFDTLGGELPGLTSAMVTASSFLTSYWYVVLALIIMIGVMTVRLRTNESVKRFMDPIILKAPVFGDLIRKVALARFSRNLASLLRAGVPILQAVEITGQTLSNYVMEDVLIPVAQKVREGGSISEELSKSKEYPPMMTQMIAVGEETGNLDTMLSKIADYYDAEVDALTDALTSALEPIMIVVLASIVGTMVVGLYLPMFEIMNSIK